MSTIQPSLKNKPFFVSKFHSCHAIFSRIQQRMHSFVQISHKKCYFRWKYVTFKNFLKPKPIPISAVLPVHSIKKGFDWWRKQKALSKRAADWLLNLARLYKGSWQAVMMAWVCALCEEQATTLLNNSQYFLWTENTLFVAQLVKGKSNWNLHRKVVKHDNDGVQASSSWRYEYDCQKAEIKRSFWPLKLGLWGRVGLITDRFLLLLLAGGVGKSALTIQLIQNQ